MCSLQSDWASLHSLVPLPVPALSCRVFAVGYAARQISSRAQLERLINNPPIAAGLAVPPADWLAVGPYLMACGQCETQVSCGQVSLVRMHMS